MMLALPMLAMVAAASPLLPPPSQVVDPKSLGPWYQRGVCLVKKQGPLAEKILATRPMSGDEMLAFIKADMQSHCFDANIPNPPPKLTSNATRGAIVEALLLRDFSAVGVARTGHVAAVARPDQPPEHGPATPAAGSAAARAEALLQLAECVVKVDPADSFAVFSKPVGSPEENGAVHALTPAFAQCLPPDLQLTEKAPVLRSYLAEAAYRVSAMQGAH